MKMKIKHSFLLSLFILLTFVPVAHSQKGDPIEDLPYKPPAEFERFSAGKIDNKRVYIDTYYFEDVPAKSGGFLGLGGTAGIENDPSSFVLNPGYKAEVCGTFAGTKRIMCLPFFGLNHPVAAPANPETKVPLNSFSDIDKIIISKWRLPDELILWYGRGNHPIAVESLHTFGKNYFPNPSAVWIPSGYWVRFCKSETPKAGECQTYTEDKSNLEQPIKYIRIGKGNPPPLLINVPRIPKSETKKTKKTVEIIKIQKKKNQK